MKAETVSPGVRRATDTEWEAYTQVPPPNGDRLREDDYRVGDAVYVWWKKYDAESGEDEPMGVGTVAGIDFGGKAVTVNLRYGGTTIRARSFTGSFFDGSGTRMVTPTRPRPADGYTTHTEGTQMNLDDVKTGLKRLMPVLEAVAAVTPNKFDNLAVAFLKALLAASDEKLATIVSLTK